MHLANAFFQGRGCPTWKKIGVGGSIAQGPGAVKGEMKGKKGGCRRRYQDTQYISTGKLVKRLEKPRIYSFFLKKKKSLIRPNPGNSYNIYRALIH